MNFPVKIVLVSLCATFSYASVIFTKSDEISYKLVEEEMDDNGNPITLTLYKVVDPTQTFAENFDKMKTKFLDSQKTIFEDGNDKISEYKDYRNYDLKMYEDNIDSIINEIVNNLNDLDEQRSNIEEEIATIKDETNDEDVDAEENMKITESEYREKLKTLNERKYHLTALMTQHCDDCDELLREYEIDVNLAKVNQDIAELEQNFLKQAAEEETKLKELDAEKAKELNLKFSNLINVLKSQLDVYKKKDNIIMQKDNIVGEWQEYSENVENVLLNVRSKIEDLTDNSLDFSKMNNNTEDMKDINSSDVEVSQQDNIKWAQYGEILSSFPDNAVLGGRDIDDVPLYIIRTKSGDNFLYGKYAHGEFRKHAYVTNYSTEYGVLKFEILTGNGYSWCSSNSYDTYNSKLPICRVKYSNSITPGTLLEDMTCRIGFGYTIETFDQNFEILSQNGCRSDY